MSDQNAPRALPSPATIVDLAAGFVADGAACLRFYSRLPLPALPFEAAPHAMPDLARATRALPLAGLVIGLVGALAFLIAAQLGLGTYLSACAGIAALVAATGALHEDGLADTADGLWGGATAEQRLVILRDSRIGSYGAAALGLALMLRVGLVAALAARMPALAVVVAIAVAAAASRTAGLLPLVMLHPARKDGASQAAGQPTQSAFTTAVALTAGLAVVFLLLAGFAASAILTALVLAFAVAAGVAQIAEVKIGGHTGDIAGAAQQTGEIAFLAGLVVFTPLAGVT